MRHTIIFTLIALTLTACGPRWKWAPGPRTSMSLEQAIAECDYEAEKAAPMMDMSKSAFAIAATQGDIKYKCMKAKGFYEQPVAPQ